jgi:hypothetical protein
MINRGARMSGHVERRVWLRALPCVLAASVILYLAQGLTVSWNHPVGLTGVVLYAVVLLEAALVLPAWSPRGATAAALAATVAHLVPAGAYLAWHATTVTEAVDHLAGLLLAAFAVIPLGWVALLAGLASLRGTLPRAETAAARGSQPIMR